MWKLENKQHFVPTVAEKDRESLVECGVRGNPVLEMPHYPWHTYTNRHRYTAHTQQPCTH